MNHSRLRHRVWLAVVLAISFPAPVLHAQEGALDEVVVTARKKQENLQDVPLSIAAFDANALARRQIDSLADVAQQTAGFSFEDYASTALETPVIRGQAQSFLTNPIQNVSTFVDGIYLQRGYMIDVGLVDMERIEILKGPQSALYGQNAFSGAISYITAKPTDDFAANASATVGMDERYEVKGAVSGPLFTDKLSFRIGAGLTQFDGSWNNNHPLRDARVSPGTRGNVGGYDNWAANAVLRFQPVDRFEAEIAYYRSEIDAEVSPQFSLIGQRAIGQFRFSLFNDLNCSPTVQFGTLGNNLWCGPLPGRPGEVPGAGVNRSTAEPSIDPRSFGQKGTNEVRRATLRYEILASLVAFYQYGRAESDVTSGRQSVRDPVAGLPTGAVFGLASGRVLFDSVPNGALESDSHELRLEYTPRDDLALMVGYYRYEATDYFSSRVYYLPPLQTVPLTELQPFSAASYTILDDETSAAYASVSYEIGAWSLSAEARRNRETKRRFTTPDPINGGPQFGGVLPGIPATPDLVPRTFEVTTPRLSVQYRPVPSSSIYLTAAKGAKAGGFNRATILPAEQTYEPETNWTYELGTKNDLLQGRLRLNVAAFYIDWTGLQVSGRETNGAPTAPAIIVNQGGARTLGAEVEASWSATKSLDLSAVLSHVRPRFNAGTTYLEAAAGNWCEPSVCNPNGDIGGNILPRSPRTKANVGASWTRPFSAGIDYNLRGDVSYQSKQYAEALNVGWVPARTLVDASIGLEADAWDIRIWAKNLLDEEYATSSLFGGSFIYGVALGERRTAGLTATYRF